MATVEMSFTPLPVHVRTARLVATAVARRSGVDEALLDEVRLAVGEACSRAVEAHQAHCPGEPVRITLTGGQGRFEVVVTDAAADGGDGVTGEPATWQPPVNGTPSGPAMGTPPPGATANGTGPAAGTASPAGTANGITTSSGTGPPAGPAGLPGAGPGEPYGLGLAVIAGLADDVQFSRTTAGLSITMSWPSAQGAG
jgi:serine/threonine-protein kinase RsbW